MVQIIERRPSFGEQFGRALGTGSGAGLQEGLANRQKAKQLAGENDAAKRQGIDLYGITDPELRKEAYKQKLTGKREQENLHEQANIDRQTAADIFGTEENDELVSTFNPKEKNKNVPKWKSMSDEQVASLELRNPKAGQIIRNLRKESASNTPISPEQMDLMKNVRSQPGFDDLDELGQYRAYIDAGVSPINSEREAKLTTPGLERKETKLEKSYASEKEFIDKITDQYKSFELEMKPRLQQMQRLDPEKIASPTAAVFLEAMGIPLGSLDDPSSELYSKLSQDMLKGLPDTYGNRILKVEVDNFLKTIPQLVNSPDGRRMIASNMLKLGEIKEIYYNQMRNMQQKYLEEEKPFPKDFQQRIFDNALPKLKQSTSEFVKMADITSVPPNTIPYFNNQGEITFVPDEPEWIEFADKEGGKRIW